MKKSAALVPKNVQKNNNKHKVFNSDTIRQDDKELGSQISITTQFSKGPTDIVEIIDESVVVVEAPDSTSIATVKICT